LRCTNLRQRRRWGYFALPVLHGHRLVGKLDAKADRKAGTFTVNALHEEVRFTTPVRADVEGRDRGVAGTPRHPRVTRPSFGSLVTAREASLGLQAFG
jgi:uncharacterized protein YcaQ